LAGDRGSKRWKKRWNDAERPADLFSTISINWSVVKGFIDHRNRAWH